MEKTSFQKYTDQERISQLVRHNFDVASGVKSGEIQFNHAFIDLERICNLSCHGCFEHMNTDRTKTKLTYKEVMDITDFAYERGAQVIVIAGAGEPTLDSDFERIIEYIYQKRMGSVVFTNGSKLDEKLSNFLFDNNVSILVKQFSMDFDKQDFIIGRVGMSKKMREGLETLMKVKKEREKTGRKTSEVGVESYISLENIEEISEILRYCRRNKLIPYLESFIIRGQDKEITKLAPTQEQLNRLFQELAKIDKEECGIQTPLKVGSPKYGGGPCIRGKASFAVHTDGSVYECISGSHEFGNIRKQSLGGILTPENPKVKKFYSDLSICEPCCLLYQLKKE
ncbi:hypothetical protein A3K73_00550 [Candidatus Pacearchaeota archaeon RBG_13_36_9]|nr:MAG: hypothetical protein A3K73_00550 [Candidatus Pacearchaeota archaeon RBG_13_36_9]HJX50041.1 radical SAM protein [Candidatus Nanoarchaeia archaeon]